MYRAINFAAIAATLLFASCGSDSTLENQDDSEAMFMAEMGRIYGFKCAICHGKNGVSVIKTAPNLNESIMSIEESMAIIKYGKTTMPPQKDVLDSKTIKGLALYIQKFK